MYVSASQRFLRKFSIQSGDAGGTVSRPLLVALIFGILAALLVVALSLVLQRLRGA
jgi:hypothetical protein